MPPRRGDVGWSGRIISLRTSERRWPGDIVPLGGRRQLADGAAMEDLTLDGTAADHVALARPEPVEPRLQERLDRRWHDDLAVVAVLAQR